ncbi:MAG: MCP four helix bundle domain-containing protein [Burkholderia contaminans]|nr:MCP four helix bundle domain-containing protein [Burkholderia contaminans]
MQFTNLKIGTKITTGFAVVLLLAAITIGVGIAMLGRLNEQALTVEQANLPRLLNANLIRQRLDTMAVAVRNLLLNDDPEVVNTSLARISSSRDSTRETIQRLAPTLARPDVRERLLKHSADYDREIANVLQLQSHGQRVEAIQRLNNDLLPIYKGYTATLDDINEFQVAETRKATASIGAIASDSRVILIGLGAAALLISIGAGWVITRSITAPIAEAV